MNFIFLDCLILIFLSLGASCENETINLVIGENKRINILEKSSNVILVQNIPSSFSAVLFQAHSHINNITLSETNDVCLHCSVTGKNIGMIYKLKTWESEARMWLLSVDKKNITVFIKISALDSDDPVPGGCNMEFNTEIAPYLKLRPEYGMLFIEFQHANVGSEREDPETSCSFSMPYISYDVFVLYLKENDFSENEYFNKIDIMSNSSLIKQTSKQVQSYMRHPDTRISILMYPNLGVVFNIIAKYTLNGEVKEACYVPITSYGCGKSEFTKYGCDFSYTFTGKAFLFLLSMYGFITAYFGHMFFSSTLFFFGFLTFFFITLVLTGRFSNFQKSGVFQISALGGLIGGALWLSLWIWLHKFVISILLIGFVLGFLLSATILYTPVGNNEINLNDRNYWLLLSTGSLFVTVILLAYFSVLLILGSSIVGTYVMLLFYDDFIGTRLSFIILNVVKRAVSENLTFATNDYPFEAKDIAIFSAWGILSFFAILFQARQIWSCRNCKNACYQNFCCCKTNQPAVNIPEVRYSPEDNQRQPLLNNDSVFYNTFD